MCQASKEWIGVDLDGTLAQYDGYKGPGVIGEPVPKMLARVKDMLAAGKNVKIFTARVAFNKTGSPIAREAIKRWTKKHFGAPLEAVSEKDPDMTELLDDRATQVVRNQGVLVQDQLKAAEEALQAIRVNANSRLRVKRILDAYWESKDR